MNLVEEQRAKVLRLRDHIQKLEARNAELQQKAHMVSLTDNKVHELIYNPEGKSYKEVADILIKDIEQLSAKAQEQELAKERLTEENRALKELLFHIQEQPPRSWYKFLIPNIRRK